MREVKIGIIGLGTVGCGVYNVISKEGEYIAHKEGLKLTVKSVYSRHYHIDLPDEIKAQSPEAIIADPEIDIICELIGGIEPANTIIKNALAAKKTVVTANKQLVASNWAELEAEARKSGAGLYFEASVGGGIPCLRAVTDSLQANYIDSVYAIINGTTNFILTKMADQGKDYLDVLKEAQELGYAEADPTSDVEGYDAMYKLSILASLAFHTRLPLEYIHREGITKVSKKDIAAAKELGYTIKLLAIAKRKGTKVQLRVHPTMLHNDHPLASVKGSFNAIYMHGSAVGEVMFYGRGAGALPTASAVVSDIICAAHAHSHKYMSFMNLPNKVDPTLKFNDNWSTGFYLRFILEDTPGSLANIATVLGNNGVSIESVIQRDIDERGASIILVTHETKELNVMDALKELENLKVVKEIASVIRVER